MIKRNDKAKLTIVNSIWLIFALLMLSYPIAWLKGGFKQSPVQKYEGMVEIVDCYDTRKSSTNRLRGEDGVEYRFKDYSRSCEELKDTWYKNWNHAVVYFDSNNSIVGLTVNYIEYLNLEEELEFQRLEGIFLPIFGGVMFFLSLTICILNYRKYRIQGGRIE